MGTAKKTTDPLHTADSVAMLLALIKPQFEPVKRLPVVAVATSSLALSQEGYGQDFGKNTTTHCKST
jgi:hypothetical protein